MWILTLVRVVLIKRFILFSQGSASESTFVCLLAAKERTVKRLKTLNPEMDERVIKSKLVGYTSGVFIVFIFFFLHVYIQTRLRLMLK